jgi:hypothetical protein
MVNRYFMKRYKMSHNKFYVLGILLMIFMFIAPVNSQEEKNNSNTLPIELIKSGKDIPLRLYLHEAGKDKMAFNLTGCNGLHYLTLGTVPCSFEFLHSEKEDCGTPVKCASSYSLIVRMGSINQRINVSETIYENATTSLFLVVFAFIFLLAFIYFILCRRLAPTAS